MFKVLDLFSGIGGFSLGLERTGHFKTIAFCEIDNYCQRVLHKHWPGVYIHSDIRTLTAKHFDGWERPDVICGGFPCQDISAAGSRVGITGERSGLWKHYSRLIQEVAPRFAIIENVAALLGNGMDVVLRDLSESGYDAEWQVISAADVGAPHVRERVWIVAYPAGDGWSGERTAIIGNRVYRAGVLAEPTGSGSTQPNWDVADANSKSERGLPIGTPAEYAVSSVGGQDVADSASVRQSRSGMPFDSIREAENREGKAGHVVNERIGNQWAVEPNVGRVANGVPARVDRLRSLGNSIVPQIATWIGQRIVEAEQQ